MVKTPGSAPASEACASVARMVTVSIKALVGGTFPCPTAGRTPMTAARPPTTPNRPRRKKCFFIIPSLLCRLNQKLRRQGANCPGWGFSLLYPSPYHKAPGFATASFLFDTASFLLHLSFLTLHLSSSRNSSNQFS